MYPLNIDKDEELPLTLKKVETIEGQRKLNCELVRL